MDLGLRTVPVDLLDVSTFGDDRTHFDAGELQRLADDIATNGQLSPVIVRPSPVTPGRYEIAAGESRTRAIRDLLGWSEIRVEVRDMSDDQLEDLMLAENEVRTNLDPIDQAAGFRRRMESRGWSVAECARRVGRPASFIADRLQLLALCDDVADLVRTGQLPIGRALSVSRLNHAGQRSAVRSGADLPTEAFRRLVSKLEADQNQSAMFSMEALEQQDWDSASSRYRDSVTEEMDNQAAGSELVGPAEVAERLGVKRSTVAQWRSRYADFPRPLAYLDDGRRSVNGRSESPGLPVWQWEQIRAWHAGRRRHAA